jgi:DNA-binding beta-propeller fold protein YncE
MHLLPILLLTSIVAQQDDPLLVVVNKPASSVTIVNAASARVIATLPTGANPHETAASPDGHWAVVSDYGAQDPGSTLTVVDLRATKIARTIQLGFTRPHGITFLADNRTVAVTSETAGMVFLVDVVEGAVKSRHPTGQRASHMLAVTRDGRRAYTANIASGSISVVSLADSSEAKFLPVGTQTEAIALSPDNREAWVGSNNTGKVYMVNVVDWKVVDSVQTSGFPYRIAFSPDGGTALITNPMSDEVHFYDTRSRARIGTVRTPGSTGQTGQPLGAIFGGDGKTAWVTLAGAGEIAVIDVESPALKSYLPAGDGPDGIAIVE